MHDPLLEFLKTTENVKSQIEPFGSKFLTENCRLQLLLDHLKSEKKKKIKTKLKRIRVLLTSAPGALFKHSKLSNFYLKISKVSFSNALHYTNFHKKLLFKVLN